MSGPNTLRWGLAGANLAAICFVTWLAHGYFLGERDELRVDLASYRGARVELLSGGISTADRDRLVHTLYRKPPAPPPPPVVTPPPPRVPGPLEGWKLTNILSLNGVVMAHLETEGPPPRIDRKALQRERGKRGRPVATPTRRAWGVVPGDELEGCVLLEIGGDHALFGRGGEHFELKLETRSTPQIRPGGGYILRPAPPSADVSEPPARTRRRPAGGRSR